MLNRSFLADIRRRAMRRGVWFRALSDLDRGILNLSAVLLDNVRSSTLRVQIVSILAKLRDAFRSPFARFSDRHGAESLRRVLGDAERLGYRSVDSLRGDRGFMEYLVFLDFHQPIGWRVYPRGT